MFVSKDSIVINGVNMGQYLTEVDFQYPKLWGNDSGRNLAGEMTATLLGIFPKITLHFRKLKKNELETIAPILDSSTQSLTYYDPFKQSNITISTYTGDWSVRNKGIVNGNRKMDGFEISFIARRKR